MYVHVCMHVCMCVCMHVCTEVAGLVVGLHDGLGVLDLSVCYHHLCVREHILLSENTFYCQCVCVCVCVCVEWVSGFGFEV